MIVNVWGDPGGQYGLMMQLAVTILSDAELSAARMAREMRAASLSDAEMGSMARAFETKAKAVEEAAAARAAMGAKAARAAE